MQSIQVLRSEIRRHPLLTVAAVALVAWASIGAAVVLGVAALACLAAPWLVEKRAPEVAVEDAVSVARRHGLQMIQRASAVKADEIGLRRMLGRELLAVSQWQARAEKAMLAKDQALAIECLAKKREHAELASVLKAQLEQQQAAVAAALPAVERARAVAAKAERTGQLLVFRKRRAETRKGVAVEASGLDDGADTFTRMERDVQRAEDEASAWESVAGTRDEATVAERFEAEERDEALRAELDGLARKVGMKRPALNAKGAA